VIILWQILVQFILRLSFGVALAMGITPSRLVAAGYYRVQLWVLMGLNTLASLAVFSSREAFGGGVSWRWLLGLTVTTAVACYVGAIVWLYERQRAGKLALLLVAALGMAGALLALAGGPGRSEGTGSLTTLHVLDLLSSGLLLGITLAAMLLGHWYLNTPTMDLLPLKRLVLAMLAAVALRAALCGVGLGLEVATEVPVGTSWWIFIAFRWLAGLVGVAVMGVMAWYTLQVPNTQSATGILYAGVILTFLGELMSQLLSASLLYPV
jgi:hypothetical protein